MTNMTVNGSCLCGAVWYRASGELSRFIHCHCSRCRKATGTGHATNLLLTPESGLQWLAGERLLGEYKVPEAERFYNRFCTRCGSPLPRNIPAIDAVVIPAGSIDTDISVMPQSRIFWDSRANWSCSDEKLPVYSEYP